MEHDDFHHQNVANTMEKERLELKTVANTVEMAVSSSKLLQIAWKMHVLNVVSTSVCVCVWNIWTDVKLLLPFLRIFTFRTVYFPGGPWTHRWHGPTKTHLCRRENVPAISWTWQAAKPRTAPSIFSTSCTLAAIWTHYGCTLLVWASVYFRILRWTTNGRCQIWSFSTCHIFLHGISDDYFIEDSFCSRSCLVLHVRDSVPNWSTEGSFLV